MPALEGRRRLGDGGFEDRLKGIEEIINKGIDVDRFLKIASSAKPLKSPENSVFSSISQCRNMQTEDRCRPG